MRACYDLSCCPASFDVVSFLMQAELERVRRGESDCEIHILPGPREGFRGDSLWPQSIEMRRHLRDEVVAPMCRMLPSATSVTVHEDRPAELAGTFGYMQYHVGLVPFFSAYADGVRPLRVDDPPAVKAKRVTITLREADHWPERNSKADEWLSAAQKLRDDGFEVLVVRDTRCADARFADFKTAPKASRDLVARAKLYVSSACNMMINNGTTAFALALDVPVLLIRPTTEGVGSIYADEGWAGVGVKRDHQIPGAPAHQRIVWKDDLAADIVDAARAFMGECERVAA